MASSALSWCALESTGLKPTEVNLLAGACALQTLRRHLPSAHALLLADGRAHLEHQRHRVEMEKGQLRKHEKGARSCEQSDSPQAQVSLISGYRGTGLVIPHRREKDQSELPAWKEEHKASHRKVRPASNTPSPA